jgi:hypothetical protein
MSVWTLEQAKGTPGTEPVAFDNNVKSGSLLVAFEAANPASTDPGVPTDTRGTSYTRIRRVVDTPSTLIGVWWYGIAPSAGANTIDFITGNNFRSYIIAEFSVDSGTIAIDDTAGTPVENGQVMASNTTATDNVTSGSMTTQGTDRLIVGVVAANNNGATVTAGTNYTQSAATNQEGFAGNPTKMEYRTLAAAGAVEGTWTSSANIGGASVLAAAFKATGAVASNQLAWIVA